MMTDAQKAVVEAATRHLWAAADRGAGQGVLSVRVKVIPLRTLREYLHYVERQVSWGRTRLSEQAAVTEQNRCAQREETRRWRDAACAGQALVRARPRWWRLRARRAWRREMDQWVQASL